MKIKFVILTHYSFGWTRNFCKLFSTSFPNDNLLVVDNNPREDQYSHFDWKPKCDEESQWLESQSDHDMTVIRLHDSVFGPHTGCTTGKGLELSIDWCLANGFDYLCILEPDCVWAVNDYEWLEALKKPIKDNGKWMTGQNYGSNGIFLHTPSLWKCIALKGISFCQQKRGEDINHPAHKERIIQYVGDCMHGNFWNEYWDQAQKAWFYCLSKNKEAQSNISPARKLRHLWQCNRDFEDHEESTLALVQELNPLMFNTPQHNQAVPINIIL